MAHEVYKAIVTAVREGIMQEPFSAEDFRRSCPGFGSGTYQAFLWKHAKGNPGGQSELFEKVARGSFRLLHPIKYGL
jgi:hypothetical protein